MNSLERQQDNQLVTDAFDYASKHSIEGLFQLLLTDLLYKQPESPWQHMEVHVRELLAWRGRGYLAPVPTFFSEDNVRAMFSALDPAGTGHVNRDQLAHAMKSIGIDVDEEELKAYDYVTFDVFNDKISSGILKLLKRFCQVTED